MQTQSREQRTKKATAKNAGSIFLARFGMGRWYFGKADYQYHPETGVERFRTTVFILLLYFPAIPTGSYLIEKKRGWFSRKIVILEERPLDWAQVLRVWSIATLSLIALLWLIKRI